jgi:hypothetical protein
MITIVPYNKKTADSDFPIGMFHVTGIDTGGTAQYFNDSPNDDLVCIKLWCRDKEQDGEQFLIAIHQNHFKELLDCISFAQQFGYIDLTKP